MNDQSLQQRAVERLRQFFGANREYKELATGQRVRIKPKPTSKQRRAERKARRAPV